MGETWKAIAGYEGLYDVSSEGRVRSATMGRLLSQRRQQVNGAYARFIVTLWRNNQRKVWSVHRLMLFAFVGPPDPGQVVRHLNGNATDNRLSNLRWGTRQENDADRHAHGAIVRGEQHGSAKLTELDVRKIRETYQKGTHALASEYGVSIRTIEFILQGKTWRHVAGGAA